MSIRFDAKTRYMFNSDYTRLFNEENTRWAARDPKHNATFLRAQEGYFNDRLNALGHVFLNEVYDALGFPRISKGQLVGWLKGENIKFFLTANEDGSIMIEFNVGGTMYTEI